VFEDCAGFKSHLAFAFYTMATQINQHIVKVNSKVLESAELKKLDKLEKEYLFFHHGAVKGPQRTSPSKGP